MLIDFYGPKKPLTSFASIDQQVLDFLNRPIAEFD